MEGTEVMKPCMNKGQLSLYSALLKVTVRANSLFKGVCSFGACRYCHVLVRSKGNWQISAWEAKELPGVLRLVLISGGMLGDGPAPSQQALEGSSTNANMSCVAKIHTWS